MCSAVDSMFPDQTTNIGRHSRAYETDFRWLRQEDGGQGTIEAEDPKCRYDLTLPPRQTRTACASNCVYRPTIWILSLDLQVVYHGTVCITEHARLLPRFLLECSGLMQTTERLTTRDTRACPSRHDQSPTALNVISDIQSFFRRLHSAWKQASIHIEHGNR